MVSIIKVMGNAVQVDVQIFMAIKCYFIPLGSCFHGKLKGLNPMEKK